MRFQACICIVAQLPLFCYAGPVQRAQVFARQQGHSYESVARESGESLSSVDTEAISGLVNLQDSTISLAGTTTTTTSLETEAIRISEPAPDVNLEVSEAPSPETVSIARDNASRSLVASDLATLTIDDTDTTSSTSKSVATTTGGLEDVASVSVLAAAQDANCSRTSTSDQSLPQSTSTTVLPSTFEGEQINSDDPPLLSYSQIDSTTTFIPRFTLISDSTGTASTTSTLGPAPQLGANGAFTDSVTIPSLTGVSITSTIAASTDVVTVTLSSTTSSAPAQLAQQEVENSSVDTTADAKALADSTTTSSILVPLATLDENNSFTDTVIIPSDRPVTTTLASVVDVTRISSSPDSITKDNAPTLSHVTVVVTERPTNAETAAPVPPAPAAPDSEVLKSASNSETGAASIESLVIVPVTSSSSAPPPEAIVTDSSSPQQTNPALDLLPTVDTAGPAPTKAASLPDDAIRNAVETRVGSDGRETVTIREIVRQREVQTVTVTIKER